MGVSLRWPPFRTRAGLGRSVLVAYGLVAVVIAATALTADLLDRPSGDFVRDPASVLGGPYATGVVSLVGAAVWFAAGIVAVFAGIVVRRRVPKELGGGALASMGGLVAFLGLDDLVLVHEQLEESYGIREPVTFTAYGLLALGWLARYRLFALRTELVLLVAAAAFLALSSLFDFAFTGMDLTEEGLKLFGIGSWTLYLMRTSYFELLADARGGAAEGRLRETESSEGGVPPTVRDRQRPAGPWPRR